MKFVPAGRGVEFVVPLSCEYQQRLGLVSNKKQPKIQLINIDGNIIYNYNYNTEIPYPKKSIKSIHYHQNLFIRN